MTQSALRAGDAVVVTGAARGLGRGIALRLAGMGVRLALWDVSSEPLEVAAQDCRLSGAEVLTSIVDVGDEAHVQSGVDAALGRYGDVFGLVNNAGIFPRASVLESTTQLWERVLRVNLLGSYLSARMLCPAMLRSGRGVVVNIVSGAALRGYPRGAHYAASKAGLLSFTKTLALELAPAVRVNGIIPAISETGQPLAEMTVEQLHAHADTIPLGRIGQPEDVAALTAFLLGPDSVFMTGQTIAVNGGATMLP